MIIINAFVDFCILVKKGITLLLNGLFSLLKPFWFILDKIFVNLYKLFEIIILFLWKIVFIISKYIVFVLSIVFKYAYLGGEYVLGNVINILGYTMLYAFYGIKYAGIIGFELLKSIYAGLIVTGKYLYDIVLFIPKKLIDGIIHFFANISTTTDKLIISPIQKLAEFLTKKYRIYQSRINNLPNNIKKSILAWYNNITFVKHMKNKQDMNRQVLLIDFNSKDAKRSDKKIVWQYQAKDEDGKFVRGVFEAFSKLDVHSFLMSEGYTVYEIKTSQTIEFFYGGRNSSNKKVNMKKLIFFLTQLSTYIRAGIPLTDAVRILSRQEKNKRMQRLYQAIIYELIMGENFSNALEKQGEAFPRLLVNMLKTSEMTGDLSEILDDMSEYYSATYKLRKQTLTSMMYPAIVLFFVVAVIVFIMIFVIPQFIEIYKNSSAELPRITVITIGISAFLKEYIVFLILGFLALSIFLRFAYKNVKFFKTIIQWFFMKIPVVRNVIIYNEVTMFTKTFSALLQHNVFITDSMEILSKITNNEIYKMIVFDAISNIARGESISSTFKNHWAIPPLAYEMMLTGERTGQLPLMMGKVATYYQEEQKNLINQIKTLIEPLVIVLLAGAVGLILLAVVVPMFSLYSNLSSGV